MMFDILGSDMFWGIIQNHTFYFSSSEMSLGIIKNMICYFLIRIIGKACSETPGGAMEDW